MTDPIIKELKEKGPESFYLFSGDEFLTKELAREFVDAYLDKESQAINFITLDGHDLDIQEMIAVAMTTSLFGNERVVLVERTNLFSAKTDKGKFLTKMITAWANNRRQTAFRCLGQIMAAHDLEAGDIVDDAQVIARTLNIREDSEDANAVMEVARAMVAENAQPLGIRDEREIEDLFERKPPKGTVIIFTAESVDKRKKLYKKLSERGRVVELEVKKERYAAGMERSFFREHVTGALKKAGKEIDKGALEEMYKRTGTDMRQLNAELEKLIPYLGSRKTIRERDVRDLFADFHESAFFELNKVVREGDLQKCLKALQDNLQMVDHPLQTVASLANEFRRLILARELLFTIFKDKWRPNISYKEFAPIAVQAKKGSPARKELGRLDPLSMKEYGLYSYLKDSQKFRMATLILIMEAILDADMELKGARIGGIAPKMVVERLVMRICEVVRRQ
jgi:DNA polymerase-3 subunit delta